MRSWIAFFVAAIVIALLGCNTDGLQEFSMDSVELRTTEPSSEGQRVTRPFKSKAHGDWFVTESTSCGGLIQTSITGIGNATHLGRFDVTGTGCILPFSEYYFNVTYVAANGDSLFWESTEVFISEEGLFEGGVFDCTGGSGRFIDAEGTITVDEVLTVTAVDETTGLPLVGTFKNTATGILTY